MSQFATKGLAAPTPAVRLAGVDKTYGRRAKRVHALAGIDLEVAAGEFVAIIGPVGCGRSTLLRLIADIETPTAGTIEIFGGPARAARLEHDTGLAGSPPGLLWWRTVLQNIALPLELQGVPYADRAQRAEEFALRLGLGDVRDRRPGRLTAESQQRVALARALAGGPRLLLLDEPFAELEEASRERLQQELATIVAQSGAAVVLATDSVAEAVFLADRVVVMSTRPGRVMQVVDVALGSARPDGLRDSPEFFDRMTAVRAALHGARVEQEAGRRDD